MKQFIRYLLLISCVLVIGVWGWSLFHFDTIQFRIKQSRAVTIQTGAGTVFVNQTGYAGNVTFDYAGRYMSNPIQNFPSILAPRLPGYIVIPNSPVAGSNMTIYRCPIWLIFTPLFLLTLALWYRSIKNWWRGTDQQGFAVEVIDKKNERQDARSAKEEKENE